jgi:hypothetical protein
MKRRTWKYLVVMLLLAAVAWLGADSFQSQRKPLAPLEAVIAQETNAGWRVARPPDVAGPYRRGENPVHVGRGTVASMTLMTPNGPVSVKAPARDDVEQMILPLRTADGSMTAALLER